jgi:hypothetical protein
VAHRAAVLRIAGERNHAESRVDVVLPPIFGNNTILSETQAALASNVHWRNPAASTIHAQVADSRRRNDAACSRATPMAP